MPSSVILLRIFPLPRTPLPVCYYCVALLVEPSLLLPPCHQTHCPPCTRSPCHTAILDPPVPPRVKALHSWCASTWGIAPVVHASAGALSSLHSFSDNLAGSVNGMLPANALLPPQHQGTVCLLVRAVLLMWLLCSSFVNHLCSVVPNRSGVLVTFTPHTHDGGKQCAPTMPSSFFHMMLPQ